MISSFVPSGDVIQALLDLGYHEDILSQASERYRSTVSLYPDLVENTDNDFVQFLQTAWVHEYVRVERSCVNAKVWTPNADEVSILEDDGYWSEVINFFLIDYLNTKKISRHQGERFKRFRCYLQTVFPIVDMDVACWYPHARQQEYTAIQYGVTEAYYPFFMSRFHRVAVEKGVPKKRMALFFNNYVAKNRETILDSSR